MGYEISEVSTLSGSKRFEVRVREGGRRDRVEFKRRFLTEREAKKFVQSIAHKEALERRAQKLSGGDPLKAHTFRSEFEYSRSLRGYAAQARESI